MRAKCRPIEFARESTRTNADELNRGDGAVSKASLVDLAGRVTHHDELERVQLFAQLDKRAEHTPLLR